MLKCFYFSEIAVFHNRNARLQNVRSVDIVVVRVFPGVAVLYLHNEIFENCFVDYLEEVKRRKQIVREVKQAIALSEFVEFENIKVE